MKKIKTKYNDIFLSVFGVVYIVWLAIEYEDFVFSDDLPSGKGGKAMILLLRLLDKYFGKTITIIVLIVLIIPFIYSSIKELVKKDIGDKEINNSYRIAKNDKFKHGDYEIHVKEITSTEKGFSGKGWVEMGIVNKVKKPVEFRNIELNEDFISVKGDLIFLEE